MVDSIWLIKKFYKDVEIDFSVNKKYHTSLVTHNFESKKMTFIDFLKEQEDK